MAAKNIMMLVLNVVTYSHFHLQRHTTGSFQSLLNSEEGKKQFVTNVTTVTISNDACDDVSGCAAGNDEGQVPPVGWKTQITFLR